MFKKFFTMKKIWDGLLVFTQETTYQVRTEARQSLVSSAEQAGLSQLVADPEDRFSRDMAHM